VVRGRIEIRTSAWPFGVAALILFALCLYRMWPGIAAYDTIKQYEQALAGQYDDWHPPIMARLWALTLAAGARGTAPMLLIQSGLYWLGFGLFAGGLARSGARWAAGATLLVALSPIMLNWLPVIVKDTQMIAAVVAAIGIVAWYRLPGLRLPWWAIGLVALFLSYAALVRANAVFAVVPLALMLAGWCGIGRWWLRVIVLGVATLLVIGISDPINHRLLDADRSGVATTLPLFDLAGIAHDAPLAAPPGLEPRQWAQAERLGCYTPFYWDPFGDAKRCGALGDEIVAQDDGQPPIMRVWIATIAAHPIAYAEHRLAHLDATLRVMTPNDEKSAAAPSKSDPNPHALGGPETPTSTALKAVAAMLERTPMGSPAVWLVFLCGIGWTLLGTAAQPARDLGLALALSGVLMTASFAVVSIASDLRYHLWLIEASGLAAVALAGCRGIPRRRLAWTMSGVAVAILASALARAHGVALRY